MSDNNPVPVDNNIGRGSGIQVHESVEPSSSVETKQGDAPALEVEDDPWLHDPMNARNWSRVRKWFTVVIARPDRFLQFIFPHSV
jgi:hypothetical protein